MAVEEVTARRPDLRYEELAEFIYGLRRSGFRAGPHQYASAHRLLLALAAHEPIRNDPRRLATYLAPVLCSSPTEQEEFYRLFDQWLSQRLPAEAENQPGGAGAEELGPELPEAERDSTPRRLAWLRSPRSRRVLLITLAAAVVAAAIIYLAFRYRPYTLNGKVLEKGTEVPVEKAKVSFARQSLETDEAGRFSFTYKSFEATPNVAVSHESYLPADPVPVGSGRVQEVTLYLTPPPPPTPSPTEATTPSQSPSPSPPATPLQTPTPPPTTVREFDGLRYLIILSAVVASLFLAYGLWRVWRVFRLKQLERWRAEKQPELLNLTVKGAGEYLYRSAAFRRLAQELRRHRRLKSNSLDVAQTVVATADEGGLFTPVYGSRRLTPEYLVLVDRQGFGDQQARLEDEIVARLRREGVFVDHYYFNADPRVCQAQGPRPVYRTLEELVTRYPDHRLLVFSDGTGLIDPLSGRPHQWLEQFSPWPLRVLLTPAPDWGYREWLLEQAGWAVRPAREQGLLTLMDITRAGELPKAPKRPARLSDYPELLVRHPERWLEEKAPDEETLEELRVQLRYYLGNEGYYLLSACAVYPQLLWGITFYFAHHLVGEKRQEETLEALVRLPWLRHGFMPDWLRAMLISNLPPEREADIRLALEALLVSHLKNPSDGFGIDIAPEPAGTKESYWAEQWKRLTQKAREFRGKKFLHDLIRTEPEGGPLRDYVFLNFMSASKLAVLLPRGLRRLLYRRGQPILGVHPVRGLIIPAALAVVVALALLAAPPKIPGGRSLSWSRNALAKLAEVIPVPTPETDPVVTPPCRDDLTAADGYRLRYVNVAVDGAPPQAADNWLGTAYSPTETFMNAQGLEYALKFKEKGREITSVNNCPQVVEPPTCTLAVGTSKCVDLLVTVTTREFSDAQVVTIDPLPRVVKTPTVSLTIRVGDPTITSLNVEVTSLGAKEGSTFRLSAPPFQATQLSLRPGGNQITAFDPQHPGDPRYAATATVTYDNSPPLPQNGAIQITVRTTDNLTPRDASVSVNMGEYKKVARRLPTGEYVVTDLLPGSYRVVASAPGYKTAIVDSVGVGAQITRVAEITLERADAASPTPTPTPTPAPELTITSVEVTFSTIKDDKDSDSTVTTRIMLGNQEVGRAQSGGGETWGAGSSNVQTIALRTPVPAAQCSQLYILVNKVSKAEDAWDVRATVGGRFSDGSRAVLLRTNDMTIGDLTTPSGFSHPLACPASRQR